MHIRFSAVQSPVWGALIIELHMGTHSQPGASPPREGPTCVKLAPVSITASFIGTGPPGTCGFVLQSAMVKSERNYVSENWWKVLILLPACSGPGVIYYMWISDVRSMAHLEMWSRPFGQAVPHTRKLRYQRRFYNAAV